MRTEWRRRGRLALLIAVASTFSPFACTPRNAIPSCDEIPAGGCPTEGGGTCDDVECDAVYRCELGSWQLRESCSGNGGPTSSGAGGAGGADGLGGCTGVTIEDENAILGCSPDLQLPDCPAGAAEQCHPCLTGGIDFFHCYDEGWEAVAFCDEDGQVVVEP